MMSIPHTFIMENWPVSDSYLFKTRKYIEIASPLLTLMASMSAGKCNL